MGDAVIVAAARTAIGTARKGSLVDVDAFELGKAAVGEALKRSGVPAEDVDDIVLGESLQGGGDIARYAAVDLGLPDIPGLANNRHCASGMAAVQSAAASIRAGMDGVVVAGGTESLSTMPMATKRVPGADEPQLWMSPSHPETPDAPAFNMSITVGENTARRCGVSRQEADEWAYHSHRRAVAATDEGRFADEIFPLEVGDGAGGTRIFEVDEHPRRDTTPEKLAALPVLNPELDGATVTAGNSSGVNDGACALVLADSRWARAHGVEPIGVVRSWASVGVPPAETGTAPTLAIPKALRRAGLELGDMDLVEINEAFAAMAVASSRVLGLDHEIVNVNGGGCSLGHPVACTGARIVVTLLQELRRRGGTLGVASLCAGGGMGSATVVEAL